MSAAQTMTLALMAPLALLTGCGSGAERSARPVEAGALALPASVQESVELRRVWSGTYFNFYPSDPSPDGRLLSEIDWSTGDLAVLDFESGEMRKVTAKGTWNESGDYADFSAFSPAGDRLAFSWATDDGHEIRIADVATGRTTTLLPAHESINYVAVEDWSPDGTAILATVVRPDRSSQIVEVSVADGSIRTLRSLSWRGPGFMEYSHDSRSIAMALPRRDDAREHDIVILARDGSRENVLVDDPDHHEQFLGWSSDGGAVLFYSDRSGSPGIWMAPVRDGRPAGPPRLLKEDVWGLSPLGMSRDALFYGIVLERPQVHIATVDPAAGRVLVEPAPVQRSSAPESDFGAWSRDGRRFAYISGVQRSRSIVIRPADGGEARELQLDLAGVPGTLNWTDDGDLLVHGADEQGRHGIFAVDLVNGATEPRLLRSPDLLFGQYYSTSPDGGHFYLSVSDDRSGPARRVVEYEVATGGTRTLAAAENGGNVVASPNGRFVAYSEMLEGEKAHRIMIVPTAGGSPRELYRTAMPNMLTGLQGMAWAGNDHLLFLEWDPARQQRKLMSLPITGGEPLNLRWGTAYSMTRLSVHPDGRQITFKAGQPRGEIWRMSNLPSAEVLTESTPATR